MTVGSSGGRREREQGGAGEVEGVVACVFDLKGGPRRRAAGEATAATAWARGGMAPVLPVATVHRSEFSGKIRKIPGDPEWIRKNPGRSG